jgi:hypothetical protein
METLLMILLVLALLIIGIFIQLFIAASFDDIAVAKGWNQQRIFHFCFWFGPLGWIYVAALPDRGDKNPPPQSNTQAKSAPVPKVSSSEPKSKEGTFVDCPQCGNICRPQNYCPKCGHQL